MKTLGERSLAALIRIVLDTAWWLAVIGMACLIALLVLSFGINVEGQNLTMDLPVALHVNPAVQDSSALLNTDARIDMLRGNLRLPVQNGAFFSANMFVIVLLLACLLWGLNHLRHVFRSLSRGFVFVSENAQRIRWVGLTVVFWELARAALVYLWSYYASLHFTANGMRFVAAADLTGSTIIAGLCIVVIAEVFREGTRLHEEQSLTI